MYTIDERLLQTIINYLSDRPFKEVAGILQAISALRKVEAQQSDEEKKNE